MRAWTTTVTRAQVAIVVALIGYAIVTGWGW